MEISLSKLIVERLKQFKIDLIVWKLVNNAFSTKMLTSLK